MAVLAIFMLALYAGCACSAPSSRIIGGNATSIDQFPSIVQVDFQFIEGGLWSQNCGATILNLVYLLSAAHCFEGPTYIASRRRIRAGTSYRNTGGEVYYVERVINHPNYDWHSTAYDSDISLVRIRTQLQYSINIQPVPIMSSGFVIPGFLPVQIAGWGVVSQIGQLPTNLHQTTLYTINHADCASRYLNSIQPAVVTNNMFCAGILGVGGQGACGSDAGGPVYIQGVLVGIISWGRRCADPEFPDVYTAVSPFTQWIVDNAV